MAELYVERGIGETRRIRVENGRIVLAWVDWGETLIIGSRIKAKIKSRIRQSGRAIAKTGRGELVLLRNVAPEFTEGAEITVEILRAPIGEKGRQKPAQGFVTDQPERRWTHYERVRSNAQEYREVREFPIDGWDDITDLALTGRVEFPNGSITISPTPAMTLIDVDGYLAPLALSLAAVPAIATALGNLDIQGSIGIDFPTLSSKDDRRAVDDALANALAGSLRERTAMNGFGFVQLVGRVDGPSILHRYTHSRTGACARRALRRAELAQGTGRVLLLRVHPSIKAKLKSEWLEELARRTGKQVRIETDPSLALEAPQAQIVSQ